MRRRFLVLALLGALVGILSGAGGRSAPPASTPGAVDAGKLAVGQFSGKLVSVPDADRMFTVTVAYQRVVPNPSFRGNPGLQRQYDRILQLQTQLASGKTRNPASTMAQLQQALAQFQQQLARTQLNAVRVAGGTANVACQAAEDVQVRTLRPPAGFDDKGNIKKYTAAELRELKGKHPNLPGYEATADLLKPGMTVQVTLATPHVPKSSAGEKDKDAPRGRPGHEDPKTGKTKQAQVIVILDDTSADGSSAPSKLRTKNDK
jgi:hypothetical protein